MKRTKIKSLIVLSGKTQRQISRETSIPEVALSEFINGRYSLSDAELHALARAIGTTPAALLDDNPQPASSEERR